ncbi:IMPACT family protein [Ideonella alba]|uniref:IMPACT family protein n=1 Tax=Ideonella alba TaxID=2824118 RepID=UPI001FFD4942|nr:YigZ family protein [Ideonella alba]
MPSTLAGPARAEQLIRKSRFIGCVQPVANRAEALAVVAALRAEHPGAAHVCWALMAGGQSAAVDDGEPSGTAGRPMLEVLRHQDLDGVLATVVRYFGGVKLGAGGLVRAKGLFTLPEGIALVPRMAAGKAHTAAGLDTRRGCATPHAAILGINPSGRPAKSGHSSLHRLPARQCGRRAAPRLARFGRPSQPFR